MTSGPDDTYHYVQFAITGQVNASGNIQSMLNYSDSVPSYGYYNLFNNCSGLLTAPELPASGLAKGCYESMFAGCTSLTQAPALPATTLALAAYCYESMFAGCTSLTQAPALPATTLATQCYYGMFRGCTSLTQAPALPATTLVTQCYSNMFNGCSSLIQAPELSATTLASYCYSYMFNGCSSLIQAPELPVTTLAICCYEYMFNGCTQLSSINVGFTEWNPSNATTNWVDGIAENGEFNCLAALDTTQTGNDRIPENWIIKKPLTITAGEDNVNIKLTKSGLLTVDGLQYKEANSDWTEYIIDKDILLSSGEYVEFRNTNTELSKSTSDYVQFAITGQVNALGNTQSMLNYSDSCTDYCYFGLFKDCSGLLTAPELPAKELAQDCYNSMFENCTSLIQAPKLPAIEVVDKCYHQMFWNCTSLIQAPELPATNSAYKCYCNMFVGCSSLTQAPDLSATTLANSCYEAMFYNCKSLSSINVGFTDWNQTNATTNWVTNVASFGEFNCPNNLSVKTGNSRIPNDWAIQKPSVLTLTAAEDNVHVQLTKSGSPTVDGLQYKKSDSEWIKYIPNQTESIELSQNDYIEFRNTKMTLSKSKDDYVKFAITGQVNASGNVQSMLNYSESCNSYCFRNLFNGCSGLLTAPELPATEVGLYSYTYMFNDCISLTQAPKLGMETFTGNGSCIAMFYNCSSLITAPELKPTILRDHCYNSMFWGCSSLTQAPELPASDLAKQCYQSMFRSCKSLSSINVGFTSWNDSLSSTMSWVNGVNTFGGLFTCPSELDVSQRGNSKIPLKWVTHNTQLNEKELIIDIGLDDYCKIGLQNNELSILSYQRSDGTFISDHNVGTHGNIKTNYPYLYFNHYSCWIITKENGLQEWNLSNNYSLPFLASQIQSIKLISSGRDFSDFYDNEYKLLGDGNIECILKLENNNIIIDDLASSATEYKFKVTFN